MAFERPFRNITIVIFLCALNLVDCEVFRLPQNVKPVRYTLTMEPHLEANVTPVPYEGSVVIELKATDDTRHIIIHKRELEINKDSIQVVSMSGVKIKVAGAESGNHETYSIFLESSLVKGEDYNLTIGNFTNNLGNRDAGFYLANYRNKNDIEKRLAVTDFEPTDARMAFPCFDEPGIKAKFIINILRTATYNSISNEQLQSTSDLGDGRFRDTFKETPPMPAYVVAFVVSEHKHTDKVERHRIFGRSDDVDSNGGFKYALEISVTILRTLEEYTGIKFAMSKMDQLAVPDFYSEYEAMENWGLVIYGESLLLCTNDSAAKDLKMCTSFIAHEFAHQWFGNLVTPSWWDYIWLSESFAVYFEYYITSLVQPSWGFMDLITIDRMHHSFDLEEEDGDSSPLNYVTQKSGKYPPFHVLYAKGCSLIRMMEHVVTPEVFRKGLQIYLQENKFSSAEPSNLYSALQKSVNEAGVNDLLERRTVADIMSSWDSVRGFPIVTVRRNYTTGSVTFEQSYRLQHNFHDQQSYIPLNYMFQSSDSRDFSKTTANVWLVGKNMTLNEKFPADGWLVVNKHQTGYYRVNYDTENWERLVQFINSENFKEIPVLNRAQLINDAFSFAEIGSLPYDIPLRLSEYIIQEKEYIPVAAFMNSISHLHFPRNYHHRRRNKSYFQNYTLKNTIASSDSEIEIFKVYMENILSGPLKYLGFEERPTDTLLDKLNRQQIVEWLCKIQYPECLKYAETKVKELKENNESHVTPDIEASVFCLGMRNATEEEFDALHRMYNTSKDIYQRRRLRSALNCNREFADIPYHVGCYHKIRRVEPEGPLNPVMLSSLIYT